MSGASDARLIARAAAFAGVTRPPPARRTTSSTATLVWRDLWPGGGRHFGMPSGPSEPLSLAEAMPAHEAVWARIVARHGPARSRWMASSAASWQFADRSFAFGVAHPADSVLSPIKLRRAGFADCEDTEDSLLHWIARMQAERLLPP